MADLYLFTVLCLVSVLSFVVAPWREADDTALTPSEVGYLRRGPRGAVAAAVCTLLAHKALRITARGGIQRDGNLPPAAPLLERAIYSRAHTAVVLADLKQAPKVRQALDEMRNSLARRCLLPTSWRRATAAVLILALVVLGVLGAIYSVRASGWELASLVVGWCGVGAVQWWLSRRTPAGRRLVRKLRRQYPKPEREPRVAAEAPDAVQVGVTVALYGVWTAAAMGVAHETMKRALSDSSLGNGSPSGGGWEDG